MHVNVPIIFDQNACKNSRDLIGGTTGS